MEDSARLICMEGQEKGAGWILWREAGGAGHDCLNLNFWENFP